MLKPEAEQQETTSERKIVSLTISEAKNGGAIVLADGATIMLTLVGLNGKVTSACAIDGIKTQISMPD